MAIRLKGKNAQAAMEFLMTYGWAILVVLVAIGALAYFGVLSPVKFLPEQCLFPSGISCDDFKVTSTDATVVIRNGLGRDITVYTLAAGNCSTANISTAVASGTQKSLTASGCSNGVAGTAFSGVLTLTYAQTDTGLTKKMVGTISAKVQ